MRLNLLLAAASAVLLILAFPRFDIAVLAPFALAPLVISIARAERRLEQFLLGYGAGIVYWAGVCYWIHFVLAVHAGMGAGLAWLAFVLFCLFKALHLGVFALGAGWLISSRWAVLTIPALWVAIERTHGSLGFAWLTLGNAGIDMAQLARVAPYTGVYGISFAFAMMATAVALVALRRPRKELLPLGVLVLLGAVPKLPEPKPAAEPAILVQPNISETAAWTPQWVRETRNRMEALTLGAVLETSHQPPKLIVWPEAPMPAYYDQDPQFRNEVDDLARRSNASLLVNVTPYNAAASPLNSVLMISPEGKPVGRYDKMNLVPFGEFVPWPFHALVAKVSSEAGDFAAGTRQVTLPVDGHHIGAFICYESVFPDFVRRFPAMGAELLVNASNDGWYGHSAARDQHLNIVRMRAAENRRWILRATNDGITATIDPAGRVLRNLPPYVDQAAHTGYSYVRELTFYSQHGDWFVWVCFAIALAGIGEALQAMRWRPAK